MKRPWNPDLWTFRTDEVSLGVYEAAADDQQGLEIRHVGGDPDELLERCKREAAELTERRRQAASE